MNRYHLITRVMSSGQFIEFSADSDEAALEYVRSTEHIQGPLHALSRITGPHSMEEVGCRDPAE